MKRNKEIYFKSYKESLNQIEYFIETICDEHIISNTFLGNMSIAISEMISLFDNYSSGGTLRFEQKNKELGFIFIDFSENVDLKRFDILKEADYSLNTEIERSIFMINALSDDLQIDSEKRCIKLMFINEGVEKDLTDHRKRYLNKYLNQKIRVS